MPRFVKRLIVNADDFGRSSAINAAVIRAHREGILTTASLMVTGEAAVEAVELARANPRLGVGLHLTLVAGRAAGDPDGVGGLVDAAGRLDEHPVRAGWRYFALRGLREALHHEVRTQFERFHQTGLELDHVNGHLHFHLHPVIWGLLRAEGPAFGLRATRVTLDPLATSLRLTRGRWVYRLSHAAVFGVLGRLARRDCRRIGWRHAARVYGLLQDGRVDADYVRRLLAELPDGDSELYAHPSLTDSRHELDALMDPEARFLVERGGVRLIRYRDL